MKKPAGSRTSSGFLQCLDLKSTLHADSKHQSVQRTGDDVKHPLPVLAQVKVVPPKVGISIKVAEADVVAVGVTVIVPLVTPTEVTWVEDVVAGMPLVPRSQPVTVPSVCAQSETAVW